MSEHVAVSSEGSGDLSVLRARRVTSRLQSLSHWRIYGRCGHIVNEQDRGHLVRKLS